jgi:hypothetical protein
MKELPPIPGPVYKLLERLITSRPMRRGTVTIRYMKCNKPDCPCATDPTKRHGPYVSVERKIGGRTVSRLATPAQAELLRQQAAAGRKFRRLIEVYWRACEEWADNELRDAQLAADPAAFKRAALRRAKRKKKNLNRE